MLLDFFFLIVLMLACIKGYRKGLIMALFSIVALIIGLAAALKLSLIVADHLKGNIYIPGRLLPFISFALIFFIVVLLVNLGGKLIDKAFRIVALGWLNRLSGMMLYIVLYTIIFSIFLFYLEKIHFIQPTVIRSSKMYPYLQSIGPWVINRLGALIPAFNNMFSDLESFFNTLPSKP